MTKSKGVSSFVATLILVSIALSLSYLVYEGVNTIAPPQQEVFSNQTVDVGGPQNLVRIDINSSLPATPLALLAGDSSSESGILFFNGQRYDSSQNLCLQNATTFFSVRTSAGTVRVASNGTTWIDGVRSNSLDVGAGWHEVVISDSSTCSVNLPGGTQAVYGGPEVRSLPLIGNTPSTTFETYIPIGVSPIPLLLAFDGSFDRIA